MRAPPHPPVMALIAHVVFGVISLLTKRKFLPQTLVQAYTNTAPPLDKSSPGGQGSERQRARERSWRAVVLHPPAWNCQSPRTSALRLRLVNESTLPGTARIRFRVRVESVGMHGFTMTLIVMEWRYGGSIGPASLSSDVNKRPGASWPPLASP